MKSPKCRKLRLSRIKRNEQRRILDWKASKKKRVSKEKKHDDKSRRSLRLMGVKPTNYVINDDKSRRSLRLMGGKPTHGQDSFLQKWPVKSNKETKTRISNKNSKTDQEFSPSLVSNDSKSINNNQEKQSSLVSNVPAPNRTIDHPPSNKNINDNLNDNDNGTDNETILTTRISEYPSLLKLLAEKLKEHSLILIREAEASQRVHNLLSQIEMFESQLKSLQPL